MDVHLVGGCVDDIIGFWLFGVNMHKDFEGMVGLSGPAVLLLSLHGGGLPYLIYMWLILMHMWWFECSVFGALF